ncbi:unnamed protein product [Dimorphilus gyrociliatus]|uniref:G-protein coupled receptors family 1 profile domain-containing protein n=1 Tax=Dimorphilus gyrociliatus TaxID=2664684 RepID=A0A7I8WAP9_9ANNE|nr:unnamed protein product [Dimorphilus gyrociliatus]
MEANINTNNSANWIQLCTTREVDTIHRSDNDKLYLEAEKFVDKLIPTICLFGIVGNLLNIIVLTRKQLQSVMDRLEKSAHDGLLALSVSDLCYCLSSFPLYLQTDSNKYTHMFMENSFMVYYSMYKGYVFNVFMMCSAWLTIVMAASRYVAVCHALQARRVISVKCTRIAIILCFVVSSVFNTPDLFGVKRYKCHPPINCTCYFVDYPNPFGSKMIHKAYIYLQPILITFIPLCILLVCNIFLLIELKRSARMRRLHVIQATSSTPRLRVTLTLISIILLFICFVFPSEVFKFLKSEPQVHQKFDNSKHIANTICNGMVAVNFSANFFLYCFVNPNFRSTMRNMLCGRLKQSNGIYSGVGGHTIIATSMTEVNAIGIRKVKGSGGIGGGGGVAGGGGGGGGSDKCEMTLLPKSL